MSRELTILKDTETNTVAEMNPISEDLVREAEFELTKSHVDEEHSELIHVYDALPVPIQKVEALTVEKEEILAKLEDKEFGIGFEKEMKLAIKENERKIALEIIKNPRHFKEEQVEDSMKLLKKWGRKENTKVLEESRELNKNKEKYTKNKIHTVVVLMATLGTFGGAFLAVPIITKIAMLSAPFFVFILLWSIFSAFTYHEFKEKDEEINRKLEELHISQKQVKEVAAVIRKIRDEKEEKIQRENFEHMRGLARTLDARDD
ncbi:MAG: hypothetical protein JXA43_03570 [Candidatus Diapherotrites archaeon]|nr:hypothetical protein [Candidatus Diapherotrites archaeon]